MQKDDVIYRWQAIDALNEATKQFLPKLKGEMADLTLRCATALVRLPSVQLEIESKKDGEWDMFELITSAWYGKQCYFKENNNIVYSRISHQLMSVNDAINEFIKEITCYG